MTLPSSTVEERGAGPARPPPALSGDTPVRGRGALIVLSIGGCAFVASHVLASTPRLVERAYGTGLGPLLSRPLSLASAVFPFAVGDAVIGLYTLWLAAVAAAAVRDAVRGRRRWRNALICGGRRLARDAGVILCLFYLLWGFHYARPGLEERIGFPAWRGTDVRELTALVESAVEAVNRGYLDVHGTADAGWPTALPEDLRALEAAVELGWARAVELLGLPPGMAARYGRVKLPWSSPVLERLGISGVYSPFTGEANVTAGQPAVRMPVSMAHEKAHQRGVAREAEAAFLGFVAGALAPDPLPRYAAATYVHGQLAAALRPRAPAEARRLDAMLLPGVRRDRTDLLAYYRRHDGAARSLQGALNDRYLRANRVRGGNRDYGRSLTFVIALSRREGGALMPRWPPGAQAGAVGAVAPTAGGDRAPAHATTSSGPSGADASLIR